MFYSFYMWSVLASCTFCFGGALLLLLPVARKGRLYSLITRGWARSILRLGGDRVEVRGLERLDSDRPYVFMANHQSYLDVVSLIGVLGHCPRFVAKKGLFYVPVLGQAMWLSGHIPVDRGRHERAVENMKKAAAQVRGGTSILVFCEGTRSLDHRLGPFKKGGFLLARESGVEIVPVAVTGSRPLMPKGQFRLRAGRVTVTVGEPIPTRDPAAASVESLMERTRRAIIDLFPADTAEARANR